MLNTYAIKFYCRESKKNKDGFSKVECSITINQERLFLVLPFLAEPKKFNGTKRPKEYTDYIALMRTRINQFMNEMLANGESVTADKLREFIRYGGYKRYTISDCFNEFISIQKKRVGVDLTQASYRKYELTRDLFYEFFDADSEITAVTPAFIQNYYAELNKKYKRNTAVSYINKTKTVIMFAMNNGKLTINPFQGLKVKKEVKPIEYLTEEELETIRTHEYPTEALQRIADVFLVQAYSGLSFIDLEELTEDDIHFIDDGMAYIRKPRHKTGIEFTAVLFPQGLEILQKYNYKLPIISNQKTNLGLKIVARECGINKNIYNHLGRKTYGTMMINRGLSMDMVAKSLGHSESRTTATYYASLHKDTVVNALSAAIRR